MGLLDRFRRHEEQENIEQRLESLEKLTESLTRRMKRLEIESESFALELVRDLDDAA